MALYAADRACSTLDKPITGDHASSLKPLGLRLTAAPWFMQGLQCAPPLPLAAQWS